MIVGIKLKLINNKKARKMNFTSLKLKLNQNL